MADTNRPLEPDVDEAEAPLPGDRVAGPGMPRWVKVSLIVTLVLVAIFVIANLTGIGGEHGPRRHGGGTQTTVVDEGHQPPVDHAP